MPRYERVHWIRWLSARGLSRADVARVLDCPAPAVAGALRTRHGRCRWDISPEMGQTMRQLRAEGWTFQAIGAAVGIPGYVVRWYLTHATWSPLVRPGPPGPGRLRGRVGGWVRRLAELGHDAGRIAELLGLEADQVLDFLGRIGPDGRVHPVRPPRPARPEGWGWRDDRGDAEALEPADPPAIAAAEVLELPERIPEQAPPAMPPRASIDPAEWTMGRAWGAADPGTYRRPELEQRARELRAAGMTRGAIAAELGVSIATVGRLTRGQEHGQGMRALGVDQAAEVLALHAAGATQGELAERFGVHASTIARALRRAPGPAAGDAGPPIVGTPDPSPATSPAGGWDYRDNGPRDDEGLEAWPMLEVEPAAVEALEPIAPPPSAAGEPWGYLNGAVARVDHAAGVRALELRAQGWTWRAIGRELGVKGETAQRAAWRAAERTES